jgi:hypothetical protein
VNTRWRRSAGLLLLTVASLGIECGDTFEFFTVINASSNAVIHFVESDTFEGTKPIGQVTLEAGQTRATHAFAPCAGEPAVLTTTDGEVLATYEPEEGCDTSSFWILTDDGAEVVPEDEYVPGQELQRTPGR